MSTHSQKSHFPSCFRLLAPFQPRALASFALPVCSVLACVGPDKAWEGHLPQGAPQPSSAGIGTWATVDAGFACSGPLFIQELHPNPTGADGDGANEYMDLHGVAGASVDGWSIQFINGANDEVYAQGNLQGVIPSSGVLVVYGGTVPLDRPALPAALQQGPDSVELVNCEGEVVQRFAYPGPGHGPDQLPEGMSMCWCGGVATQCQPTPGEDSPEACVSADGCEDGCSDDTADHTVDAGMPMGRGDADDAAWSDDGGGAESLLDAARARCSGAAQQGIRIQEVLFDPAGADSLSAEFVEISVPPHETTQGLRLVHWDAGAGAEVWSQDLSATTTPIVLLGGIDGATAALPAMLQNGPDAIWLEDCAGGVLDAVVYGVGDHKLPDWMDLERYPAIEGRASHSLSACDGGRDSHGWFRGGAAPPTPGAPNAGWLDTRVCGPSCEASAPGTALIQEVLFNPEGADTGHEFVEIVSSDGYLPAGLELRFINGATGEAWVSPLVLEVAPESAGLWLVAGEHVSGADQLLHTTLQNGPDGLQLWSCDGMLLDTVGWGEAPVDAHWVEGEGVLGVREGCSMTRSFDARDTQDNRRDFTPDCSPSPGLR